MFKKEFRITYPDGRTAEVETSNPDLIRLERKFNIGVSTLTESMHAEYLTYLAWAAARRLEPGGNHPDWDEFSATADVELKQNRDDIEEQLADLEAEKDAEEIKSSEYAARKRHLQRALDEITETEAKDGATARSGRGLGEAAADPSPT